MNACRSCSDTSDIVPLCPSQRLFLKPIARLNVSVQLPQLKAPDKSISSWEVMERLRKMVKPEKFSVLRVTKSTLEFIRFEGEVETKGKLLGLVSKLDQKTIKLSGFTDVLKVRAAEAKIPFPNRHVWDSFFREAKHMNEMKPGERPDTLHITNLPCKWFTLPEYRDKDEKPSEYIFRKVFETYGEVRYVDVPCTDPYRTRMKNKTTTGIGIKTFSFDEGHSFEGFVQYKEYVSFLKAMTALRGMQLLYKEGDKAWVAAMKVDYDRSKQMTDHNIRRRHVERERFIQQDAQLLDKERRLWEAIETKKSEIQQQKEVEQLKAIEHEKEKTKNKKKQSLKEIEDAEKERKRIKRRLAREEQKLREAQQKLENIHLLDMLLEKAKVKQLLKKKAKKEKNKRKMKIQTVPEQTEQEEEEDRELLQNRELELRRRLLVKYKEALDKQLGVDDEEETETPSEAGPRNGANQEVVSSPKSEDTAEAGPCAEADKIELQPDEAGCSTEAHSTVEPGNETAKDQTESNNKHLEEGAVDSTSNELIIECLDEEEVQENVSKRPAKVAFSPEKSDPPSSRDASPSSDGQGSPVIQMSASDDSLESSDSESSISLSSEQESESSKSESEEEPPKKKEKTTKKTKKKKHKHKSKKEKKKKSSSKERKSKKRKHSSKEEKKADKSDREDADEAGTSSGQRLHSQVGWRGRGGNWRGRYPRQYRGGGRGGRPPQWFDGGQEFFDFGFFPPPWHFHAGGGRGEPFFHPRGFQRPNMRRPFYRHPGQPPSEYYDNYNKEYERYFLKFARTDSKRQSDDDYSNERSRSGSSDRDHYRSRKHSRGSRRSWSRESRRSSRSRSRSRGHRRSRSRSHRRVTTARSRSRSRDRNRSKSRSRDRSRSRRSSRSRSRERRRSRSHSRGDKKHERSRSRSKNRSHSRSPSKHRSKSRSPQKTRSKSPQTQRSKSRSLSKQRSKSPPKKRLKSRSLSKERSKSRSKERSKAKSRSKSRTRSGSNKD